MSAKFWDAAHITWAKRFLAGNSTLAGAVAEMSEIYPHITRSSIHKGFTRAGEPPPSKFLMSAWGPKGLRSTPQKVTIPAPDPFEAAAHQPVQSDVQTSHSSSKHTIMGGVAPFADLIRAARKSPSLEVLCNILDLPPSKVKALIVDAQAAGHAIRTGAASIGLGVEPVTDIVDAGVPPTVGSRFRVGVLSDPHFGSKYCLRPQIKDLVHRMYRAGVRDILGPGDWLDGCYPHGQFELTYSGIEDQTADMCRVLPKLDGLRYHGITGNHCETFTKPTGLNIGRYIEGYFRDHGRNDIRFYGDRGATLRIGGTTVHMWHPMGSCSYAVSYKLQKRVESYSSAEKPGILLTGHFHKSCYLFTRGVHAFACPTMQGGGSAFSNALGGGAPAMGGLILGWKLTADSTIRDFLIRPISYFQVERAKETV